MRADSILGDTMSFKEMLKDMVFYPKKEKERYPARQNEEAVYTEFPLFYKDEDGTPTGEIKAYMYVLSCPICGREAKRSDTFCRECGNKVTK